MLPSSNASHTLCFSPSRYSLAPVLVLTHCKQASRNFYAVYTSVPG